MFAKNFQKEKSLCRTHFIKDVIQFQIEPFLPKPKWRDLPKEYGNWNNIYHKFRSWCDLGVFEKILQSLVETGRKYFLVEMDSTFCKVHQHSAGAKKILGNQAIRLKSFVGQAPMNDFDKELYKSRNIIERFFQRIKNYRHVTTRYDKLSVCFLNFVFLAAVMIQI